MFTPGVMQLAMCLAIGLLFFGNRLPSTMRSIGTSIKAFKEGMHDGGTIEEDTPSK